MLFYRNNYDMGRMSHVTRRNLIDISVLSEDAQEQIGNIIDEDRRASRTNSLKSRIDQLQEELDTLQ